jgi:hypothetical protein
MVKKKTTKKVSKEKAFEKKIKNKCCGLEFASSCKSGGSAIYGVGFLGAVIYYFSTATGFWVGVLGLLKALVWPAMLVFELMKFLGM